MSSKLQPNLQVVCKCYFFKSLFVEQLVLGVFTLQQYFVNEIIIKVSVTKVKFVFAIRIIFNEKQCFLCVVLFWIQLI